MGRQSTTVRAVAELDGKIKALESQIAALGTAKDIILALHRHPAVPWPKGKRKDAPQKEAE